MFAGIHYAAGVRFGALVVLQDVTKIRGLENLRRDFVANVSHELKTPLTSIKGFIETLLDGEEDVAIRREFMGIIHRQTERLNELIDDLLDLAKIEKDVERGTMEFGLGDVYGSVSSALELCRSKWDARRDDLVLDGTPGYMAPINHRLLEQAVLNLADNALKYGAPDTKVRVSIRRTNREIVITVADAGPGIAEEHVPRLFERFYRADKARSRDIGGSGLGLAIVKHIIEAHGGFVTVRSVVGKGSEFALHLPGAGVG